MSDDKDNLDITTQLVHASGRNQPPTGQPTATPIYASATYTYESMAEIDRVFGGELPGYIYTRYGNPTVTALETAIQVIEAGATACAYSSGMAALHAALLEIGRAHVSTPVTVASRMPSPAWKKKTIGKTLYI